MSYVRTREPGHPATYQIRCDWLGCDAVHTPDPLPRAADQARAAAQGDMWRVPNSSKVRRRRAGGIVDLCPAHRGAQP